VGRGEREGKGQQLLDYNNFLVPCIPRRRRETKTRRERKTRRRKRRNERNTIVRTPQGLQLLPLH